MKSLGKVLYHYNLLDFTAFLASDDFAKKNSDLEKEWKRIIEWKENTEQQHKEKEEGMMFIVITNTV